MVQTSLLHMGEQPGLPSVSVTNSSPRQDRTNTRRERLRRPHRRIVPMLEQCLWGLRTLPPVQRCLAVTANTERPMRRVGKLL